MAGSKKPCHGCGKTGYREVDKVCNECQKDLRDLKTLRESLAKSGRVKLYHMAECDYELPYISMGSNAEAGREFQTVFHALLKSIVRYDSTDRGWAKKDKLIEGCQSYDQYVWVDSDIAEKLNEVYQKVIEVAAMAYLSGKERGQSLLLNLAQGGLSMDDFNKQAKSKY